VAAAIIRAIHQVDPTVPVYDVRTMEARMKDSMARQRFSTLMLGAFALFALLLAIVGVYGVMSYLVSQGTHDIGVRMALGAQRRSVYQLILGQSVWLVAVGLALGSALAVGAAQLMRQLLFGVDSWDAPTLVMVAAVLAFSALLASWIPARRAASVNPIEVLRAD
jgi:macrolide transport system ATP-binding/permease protein